MGIFAKRFQPPIDLDAQIAEIIAAAKRGELELPDPATVSDPDDRRLVELLLALQHGDEDETDAQPPGPAANSPIGEPTSHVSSPERDDPDVEDHDDDQPVAEPEPDETVRHDDDPLAKWLAAERPDASSRRTGIAGVPWWYE